MATQKSGMIIELENCRTVTTPHTQHSNQTHPMLMFLILTPRTFFSPRWAWEFAHPVYMCFVDVERAYDRVSQGALWGTLWEYGILGPSLQAIRNKATPQDPDQLNGSHVVGEDVGMACCFKGVLLPPLLETEIEDEDGEREEKDDSGDIEGMKA
ncbi:hypothetical protein L3Q82_003752 [Scortum barcoo]|uniref:Uncharacterized protein n=1 Tax=Scortum barcoo TaxID=214431 RepID=A0ACB8X704_9TELE|nr:hypothetical protein L3Q82_003752 [Scortum barcoo]